MQEFCPSCAKNDIKSRIKAFQLNFEEAVFMCSSDECMWPVGCQDLTVFKRPIGKDWSKNWDVAASKHFKNEPDPLLELSAYTPPQTPGTELAIKDASVTSSIVQGSTSSIVQGSTNVVMQGSTNGVVQGSRNGVMQGSTNGVVQGSTNSVVQGKTKIVPEKAFNSKPVSGENFRNAEDFEDNGFEELDIILSSFDEDFSCFDSDDESSKISKPKLVVSNPVNCKLDKESIRDSVFTEQCDKTSTLNRVSKQQIKCKNENIKNKTTSLACKVEIKDEIKDEKPSIPKLSRIEEKSRFGPRLIKRKGSKFSNIEKFDFNDVIKQKSKKMKQDPCKNEPVKVEIHIPGQTQIKKEIKKEKGNDGSQKVIKIIKVEKVENNSFDFDLDKMLNDTSTNVNKLANNVELSHYNENDIKCVDKDEIDFDSLLALTSSSKDSGVDQDIIDNSGVDMELEELLAGFSDDLTSSITYNTHKTPNEETDENKWINSLFE